MYSIITRFLKIIGSKTSDVTFNPYELMIIHLIGFISQEYFCASWLNNIEYEVFDSIVAQDNRYGTKIKLLLIDLFAKCNTWPEWNNNIDSPTMVDAFEWFEKYRTWIREKYVVE